MLGPTVQMGPATPDAVRIQLLGSASAWRGDTRILFKTRKTLAVLAYLAATADTQRRQDLAALFWPSYDADRARASLRTTLGYLRQALGDAVHGALLTTRDAVALSISRRLAIDIYTLDQTRLLAARVASIPGLTAQLQRAADVYHGPFLADVSLPEVPEFDAWVEGQRTRWLNAVSTVLDRLSALQKADGDLGPALATLERWVAIDPGAEVAWQRLIRMRLESGDSTGAQQAWEACREMLIDLDARPGGEVLTLGTRIPCPTSPAVLASLRGDGAPAEGAGAEPGPAPLLGRERELVAIRAAYERARAGSTQVVVVEGQAGIGKSYLARTALAELALRGGDVLAGCAFEAGRGLPYAAVVEALRGRLHHENAPDDLVDDVWLAELAVLLPELRTRYPDLPDECRDIRLRQARLLEAVARLGQALAERAPVVLLVDDVQWADADTRHVITYSIRRWRQTGTPALVLLASRSEETGTRQGLARWLAGLEREAPVLRLPLGPLAAEDVRRWVEALAGHRQLDATGGPAAAFGRWLMDWTGGQPSFVVRVLRTLLDEGAVGLRPAPGEGWVLDVDRATDDEGSRQRLEEVLARGLRASARDLLRRLDATASALLAAAVTLDERFSADSVLMVARVGELAGLRALERLVRVQVLREGGDGRYTFSHRLVRTALDAEVGEARRHLYRLRALELTERPTDARAGLVATR